MRKIELKNFGQIDELREDFMEEEFVVNLVNCEIKERVKVMGFLSGLTFKSGTLKKLNKDEFLVSFK